ncbi:putative membrane protein YphA (DoxX/SURF4 family) [Pedobacter sp. UYEF25]
MLLNFLTLVSAFSFLYYGLTFFTKSGMKEEFERYKLEKFRNLIGCLQLLGGFGLLIGLIWQPALSISSGGLATLMLIGFGVRIKMKDGFLESLPSFAFMIINGYICFTSIGL